MSSRARIRSDISIWFALHAFMSQTVTATDLTHGVRLWRILCSASTSQTIESMLSVMAHELSFQFCV